MRGDDWQQHWSEYATDVLTPPVWERHSARVWFSSVRQALETAFSTLVDSFGLHFPRAHCTWGLLTRIGAKIAPTTSASWSIGTLTARTRTTNLDFGPPTTWRDDFE
jgi:hypothetical protein